MRLSVKKYDQLLRGESVSFCSPAKINTYLDIVGRREDGYHLLRSIFLPVSLYDYLNVRLTNRQGVSVICREKWFNKNDNSIVKAYKVFIFHTGFRQGLRIELIKNIPVGSGLGGASSNAATLLNILNRLMVFKTGRGLKRSELLKLSSKVGADVPFFIIGKPAMVEGIGEIVKPLKVSEDINAVIVFPCIPFFTKDMYKEYDRLNKLTKTIKGDNNLPPFLGLESVSGSVFNIFESVLRGKNLRIVMELKSKLKKLGAQASALSGSGSAGFGLFENNEDARSAFERLSREYLNFRVFSVRVLRGRKIE